MQYIENKMHANTQRFVVHFKQIDGERVVE